MLHAAEFTTGPRKAGFVSAPGDPEPNQPGGGVWVRGVGGEVTNKFSSTNTGSVSEIRRLMHRRT
jgi:hypothetical protein